MEGKGERREGKGRGGERGGLCSCKNSLKYALVKTIHCESKNRATFLFLINILTSLIRSHHFLGPAIFISVNSVVPVLTLILKQPVRTVAASIVHSKLDYCNSLL